MTRSPDDPIDVYRFVAATPKKVRGREFFDFKRSFVLDTKIFSSIIYILYTGGVLSPPVGTPRYRSFS
jgi:hypothetical protein